MIITLFLVQLFLVFAHSKLAFVAIIARHGARQMENAKYFNITEDETMKRNPGRLTDVGKHQLHLLGRQLRHKYTKEEQLLSNDYNPEEVVFRSSGLNRTIESAQGFLSGFYHPGTGPILRRELVKLAKPGIHVENFQEIIGKLKSTALPYFMQTVPVHTTTETKDYLFNAHTECTTLKQDSRYYASEFRKIDERFKDLYELIHKEYNYSVTSALDIYMFYDNLASIIGNYGRDSVKIKSEDIDKFGNASLYQTLNMFLRSPVKLKLMSYGILRGIRHYFNLTVSKNQTDDKDRLKLAYFQMSDAHVLAIIKLLGIDIPASVPFASSLIFELYQVGEKYEVKLLYNGKTTRLGKQEVIDYNNFTQLLDKNMYDSMEEFMEKCQEYTVVEETGSSTVLIVLIIIFSIATALIVIITFYKYVCKAEEKAEEEVPMLVEKEEGKETKKERPNELDKMSMLNPDIVINE